MEIARFLCTFLLALIAVGKLFDVCRIFISYWLRTLLVFAISTLPIPFIDIAFSKLKFVVDITILFLKPSLKVDLDWKV